MSFRTTIPDFMLARPLYRGSLVSFFTVDQSGERTNTLATLYAAPTGSTTLTNPQRLDATGKFSAPVYINVPVIAEVVGRNVASHTTGVINARGTWRDDWVTATVYFTTDLVQDPATKSVYVVADDYVSSGSVAADVVAGHLVLILDQLALTAVPLASGLWGPFTDVASAATCNIGATDTVFVNITGTIGVSSFGSAINRFRVVKTASAVAFTNGVSLICPNDASFTSYAGQTFIAVSDAGAVWRIIGSGTTSSATPADYARVRRLARAAAAFIQT